MKIILTLVLCVFFFISGCQSVHKKEDSKKSAIKEKYKNSMNVREQKEIYFYANSIRNSCGGMYLKYSGEIGESKRKGSLIKDIEQITSKYKGVLSKKVELNRPSYSPVYGSNVLDALEESSNLCRSALLKYIDDINLAFLENREIVNSAENVFDFFNKNTRLYATSYAFEYNTYSYSGNILKFSMGEYTNLMYTYYSFLNKVINKIKDSSLDGVSEAFSLVTKQRDNVEKDFNIISGLFFIQKTNKKIKDKVVEEKIKALRESFLSRTDYYYSSIQGEYNKFLGDHLDGTLALDSYLSMYIDVALQEQELAPKVREYQELMLNVLTI